MFREAAFAGGEESGRRAFVKRSLDRPVRYGVAALAVGAAVLVKLLLDPLTAQDTPFLLILGAIMVGAWYGGLGPGLLATALSTLATDYFFLVPEGFLYDLRPRASGPWRVRGGGDTGLRAYGLAALGEGSGRAVARWRQRDTRKTCARARNASAFWPRAARRSPPRSITGPRSPTWPASRCPPWPTGAPSTCSMTTARSRGSPWSIPTPQRSRWPSSCKSVTRRIPTRPGAYAKCFETGEPDMMAEIPEELLDQIAVDAEHREMMRKLGLKSYMVVPMVARGRNHGAITFVSAESGRRYDESDLRLAEELARTAALAVDNAKLYEEAQREISDRKEAEARLKEAEARFRTLVEHIPAMTYMEAADKHAENNAFLYISPQVEAVLGYPPEEWISDPLLFRKTLHPDDRERVLAEDARTNITGEPFQMEYRQRAKDGRVVWVRDESVLVRDHEGGNPYWLGVQFDITDRREAEEALARARDATGRSSSRPPRASLSWISRPSSSWRPTPPTGTCSATRAQDMLGLGLTLYDVVAHDRESIDRYVIASCRTGSSSSASGATAGRTGRSSTSRSAPASSPTAAARPCASSCTT